MEYIKSGRLISLGLMLAFLYGLFQSSTSASTPMNMFHDSLKLQNMCASDALYIRPGRRQLGLNFMPFYNRAAGAKDGSSNKVPLGDRLGRWNMIGLTHGVGGAPGGTLSGGTTPNLLAASTALAAGFQNFTDTSFSDSSQQLGYYSVPLDFDEVGVRGEGQFFITPGIGFQIKGGIVSYQQSPLFLDQTASASINGFTGADVMTTETYLMTDTKRIQVAKEIGLNVERYSKTALEDTTIELFLMQKFGMNDKDGKHAVTLTPYVSVGVVIPTGVKKNQDYAFSLPTGNNGFWAVSAQGKISLEFVDTLEVSVGGGATFFQEANQTSIRMPTSVTQQSIYPWKANITRKPGTSWNLHAGFVARDFIDSLSFYLNAFYARHERDSITMNDTTTRNALFVPGRTADESVWESKMLHFGFDYQVAPELSLGGAVQTPFTGRRIYRTTTLMGSLRFTF